MSPRCSSLTRLLRFWLNVMKLLLSFSGYEVYDPNERGFIAFPKIELELLHCLKSAVLWESKWKRSFLDSPPSTIDEIVSYIGCMNFEDKVVPRIEERITSDHLTKIKSYISDSMSASVLMNRPNQNRSSEKMTTDLIYYYLVTFQIPFEVENWHLNRLLMLIRICSVKNAAAANSGQASRSAAKQRAAINRARRARAGSKG